MSRKTPTRIEIHRLKRHLNGPKSELIPFHDLDDKERVIVSESIFSKIYTSKKDPYEAYAEVLDDWGIICPHPQHMKLYSGTVASLFPLFPHKWYKCQVCDCLCINEDFHEESVKMAK